MVSAVLISVFLLGSPTPSFAKIYKYKDENGKSHYTDDPLMIPEKYRDEEEPANPVKKPVVKEKTAPPADKPPLTYKIDVQEKVADLEGVWSGWGGVRLEKDGSEYTGTYKDTFGTDVGKLLLEVNDDLDREYSGEWWEGTARIGELKYKVHDKGKTIRGTWCALEASTVNPGKPSCDDPSSFTWTKIK